MPFKKEIQRAVDNRRMMNGHIVDVATRTFWKRRSELNPKFKEVKDKGKITKKSASIIIHQILEHTENDQERVDVAHGFINVLDELHETKYSTKTKANKPYRVLIKHLKNAIENWSGDTYTKWDPKTYSRYNMKNMIHELLDGTSTKFMTASTLIKEYKKRYGGIGSISMYSHQPHDWDDYTIIHVIGTSPRGTRGARVKNSTWVTHLTDPEKIAKRVRKEGIGSKQPWTDLKIDIRTPEQRYELDF